MSSLEQIKGINSRQIKLLQENGISSAEALAMSPSGVVSDIDGLGDKTAKKLIWSARNSLGMSDFIPAEEIDEDTEYITTGSSQLNQILGGGLSTGKLTEVYGPFKSGKTNLAHTVAVTIQLPKKQDGLAASVAYIDSENTFSREKIMRIAKRFGLDPKKVLTQIFHARIYSSDHQQQMIGKAEMLCKTRNVRLIIVDSLMALMRAEYIGIGMLARRQAVLNNMIHALSRIAETYNCAVLLTNQVATKMVGMFSADDAIGGNIVGHGCHIRIMFKTKGFSSNNSLKRRAVIVDAPDLPPEECEFFITSTGIADTEITNNTLSKGLDFKIEDIFDDENEAFEEGNESNGETEHQNLLQVKGIGKGTLNNLIEQGISTIQALVDANAEDLAIKMSGVSAKKIIEWQTNAQKLIQT